MDAALASGILDKVPEKKGADYPGLSKADIKLVVNSSFAHSPTRCTNLQRPPASRDGSTEAQAKKALGENKGDVVKTLLSLVSV